MVNLNKRIVAIDQIAEIDIRDFSNGFVSVYLKDNSVELVDAFFAVELVWLLSPSALEGDNRIKWKKHAWAIHNFVGHPIMQLLAYAKQYKLAIWMHDITIPKPTSLK